MRWESAGVLWTDSKQVQPDDTFVSKVLDVSQLLCENARRRSSVLNLDCVYALQLCLAPPVLPHIAQRHIVRSSLATVDCQMEDSGLSDGG